MCQACIENSNRPIAIVDTATGAVLYEGLDEDTAAETLRPGTVFARERTSKFALFLARRAAARVRFAKELKGGEA
jgi:hypothetical protein